MGCWYTAFGAQESVLNRCADFQHFVTLTCDGQRVPVPDGCQGLIVINIESYAGGCKMWTLSSTDELPTMRSWASQSMQDGLLEIVAVNNAIHLGEIQVGLSQAIKVAQCRRVEIVTTASLPMQADGEPWLSPPAIVEIRHHQKAVMGAHTSGTWGEVATGCFRTLDWALDEGLID